MNEGAVRLSEAKSLLQGWQWVKLDEVCGEAKTRDPRLFPEASFRYIDISSIDAARKQIIGTRAILGKDAPSRARQVVKANDVLVATTRPNLNAVALVPAELNDEICSTGFCVLRPDNKIEPLLLFYFVQTNDFVRLISGEVRGMLYPAVTDSQVRAIDIPLAPLSKQKCIAAKVQDLMKEVERARTACEARLEAAKALPKAYLRQVFESEEAKKWERRRLGELFDVQQGVAMSPYRREGVSPRPFLRTLNILWGRVDLSTLDKMDFTDEEVSELSLKPGDLLVCEGGEVGRTAIWRGEMDTCLHQNHVHRLRKLSDSVMPEFYMYWMQAAFQVFQSYSGAESKTTIPNLSGNRLKSFMFPLPPAEEQKRIASELKDRMAGVDKLKADIEKQLGNIKALPQAILRKAFRGEL
jgi:type I restriction enzyme S subunit